MTTPTIFSRLEELYHQLVDLDDETRAPLLEAARRSDPELVEELERLLRREAASAGEALIELSGMQEVPQAGERIGPYRLVHQLGEGGMGVVFEAEQETPVQRRVALKLLRPGLWGVTAVARFARERQALALMSHPAIARVYDAGATAEGRPYVAMELVKGEAITAFLDRRRATIRQRLELLVKLFRAVQHAHQKGLLHRDLKPSNVLALEQDGDLAAKIIDFGIAKAIDERHQEGAYTRLGDVVGTLEYMSPEQASGGALDTRSDIYALGVLTYEVLTGSVPLAGPGAEGVEAIDELRRRIREEDPVRPSERVRRLAESAPDVAASRGVSAEQLRRALRGDLDWIVLKALAKRPDHRYDSAAALAADVEAHLNDEPVSAGPLSRRYRLAKFVRRHTLAVGAGAALVASLLLTAVTSTALYLRAEAARREAETQRQTAVAVSGFLRETLASADPVVTQSREALTVREVLDEAVWRIPFALAQQPRVAAALQLTVGSAYENLGLIDRAQESFAAAVKLLEDSGAEHDRVDALLRLSEVRHSVGDLAGAEEAASAALAASELAAQVQSRGSARSRRALALIHRDRGDWSAAEDLLRDALQILELEPDEATRADLLRDLGLLLSDRGRHDEAVAILEEAVQAKRAAVGETHSEVAQALNDLAWALTATRDNRRALALHREALAILEAVYPTDHPTVTVARAGLAGTLRELGHDEEAVAVLEQSLATFRRTLGPEHPYVAHTLNNLALALEHQGDFGRAVQLYAEAANHYARLYGEEHPQHAIARYNLARALRLHGDAAAAERECRASLRIRRAQLRPDHPDIARNLTLLAELRRDEQDLAGALPLLREGLDLRLQALPEIHPLTARSLYLLGLTEMELGQDEEAEGHLLESRRLYRSLAEGDPETHKPNVERSTAALNELERRAVRAAGSPGS